jgi:hypothetical protein
VKYFWQDENENQWILPVILDKGIPMTYTKDPGEEITDKLEAIFRYINGTRNFILVISNRTAFVNSFFYYIGITWMTNYNKTFEIVDLRSIKEDRTLLQKMEYAPLLLVPYVDTDTYTMRDVVDMIGAILIKRQVRNMPTIIELYSRKSAEKITEKERLGLLQSLSSVYGDSCAGTFLDKKSNVKIIKMR